MRPQSFEEPKPNRVVHQITFRVCLRDMDSVNIYYATYYEWMERSLAEFLHHAGHPLAEIFDDGLALPAVQSGCSYFAPVKLGDVLQVRSWISEIGTTSFTMIHDFIRLSNGERVAQGFVIHVWVNRPEMEPTPLPSWFRKLSAAAG